MRTIQLTESEWDTVIEMMRDRYSNYKNWRRMGREEEDVTSQRYRDVLVKLQIERNEHRERVYEQERERRAAALQARKLGQASSQSSQADEQVVQIDITDGR